MIQDRFTQVGLSKQASLGTPISTGSFRVGVKSGQVASMDIDEDDIGTTWSTRLSEGQDRGAMTPGASFEVVAMRQSIGLLLLAALGTDTPSGSSPTRSHVFTPGATLPYLTLNTAKGGSFYRTSDCRMNELELSWEGTKALTAKATLIGCLLAFQSSDTTYSIDERPGADGVLKGCGGTFQIGGVDAVIKGGSIKIANNVEAVHGSASPLPSDVFQGALDITFSLTVVVPDLLQFRTVVTGSSAGTTVSCVPVSGGHVLCSFTDGTNTLALESQSLVFMTEFPDTDAGGGPVEITLEGTVAAGTAPFTATLVNDVTSY